MQISIDQTIAFQSWLAHRACLRYLVSLLLLQEKNPFVNDQSDSLQHQFKFVAVYLEATSDAAQGLLRDHSWWSSEDLM